jgi:hypothetical protein
MKRSWLLLGLLGIGAAHAQGQATFSLPLPSADLPDGVLTIKVIGSGMGDLKVGQEVSLERLEGESVAESKSAKAGADGRARFEALRTGARYRAVASADGRQHRSQPFAGPEKGGLRLLLSLGGSAGHPGNTGQGPASAPSEPGLPPGHPAVPGAMPSGHPPAGEGGGAAELSPEPELPDGTLLVRVRLGRAGKPLAGARVRVKTEARVIWASGEGGPARAFEARTNAEGELRLSLAAGPASRPASQPASQPAKQAPSAVLTVLHEGLSYSSTRIAAPAKGGLRAVFTVFGKSADPALLSLGPGSHHVAQVGEGALGFMQVLRLLNTGDRVFDPGPAGLELPLPDGAASAELPATMRSIARIDGEAGTLRVLAPIPPGQLMIQLFYEIPYQGSELELRQRLPIAAGETVLRLLKDPRVRVVGPSLGKGEPVTNGDERLFPLAPVKAGGALELTLLGLPHRDRRPVHAAIALASLIALWAIIAGWLGPRRRREREARRELLLGQLVQLERGKKKNAEEVARRRRELLAELRQVWDEPW